MDRQKLKGRRTAKKKGGDEAGQHAREATPSGDGIAELRVGLIFDDGASDAVDKDPDEGCGHPTRQPTAGNHRDSEEEAIPGLSNLEQREKLGDGEAALRT